MERKPRIGYKLVGEEVHIRLIFEHMIQKSLSNFDVYTINTQINSDKIIKSEYGFIPEIQTKFAIILCHFRKIWKFHNQNDLSNLEVLSIIIRLIIFLVRMECEFTIGSYRLLTSHKHHSSPSSKFVYKVMEDICKECSLLLLEDEFLYVHRNFLLEDKEEIDLLTSTETIIRYVSEKERVPYFKDTRLFGDLLSHRSIRFEKSTTYVTEANQEKEIAERIKFFVEEAAKKHRLNVIY